MNTVITVQVALILNNHHEKHPMALLLRKRLILIEKEGDDGSSYGTDPGMDNATDAVLVRDLSITLNKVMLLVAT